MIEIHEAPPVFEKLIHYNEEKHEKVFLTINTFRDVEYLSDFMNLFEQNVDIKYEND